MDPPIRRPVADWVDKNHLLESEAFVQDYRDGFAGPIISYWARIDQKSRWFPPPPPNN